MKSEAMWFMTSTVGSSKNNDDNIGEALTKSHADTTA